tara:strand:+ start:547 stop:1428 length:882 start_codon:yes stop_codon:yes gene_type:complete
LKYQSEDGVNIEVKQVPKGRGHAYKITIDPLGPKNSNAGTFEMPSVTTILRQADGSAVDPISRWSVKQALDSMQWVMHEEEEPYITEKNLEVAKKAPMVELKKAGDRGTTFHGAMEVWFSNSVGTQQYLKGHGIHEVDAAKAVVCFAKISEWIKSLNYKVVATELPVYDKSLRVAGTIDMLLSDGLDTVYVCDLKTGKNIYKKDGMQVGAYISAVVNMLGDGLHLWSPFPEGLPIGDRIGSLQVGGAVIHMDVEKETVKINHVSDDMISNIGFMSAKKLYDMNKTSKFEVQKL